LPPDEFILFLDENIHNCQPILRALQAANIPYRRFGDYFSPGTPDETWLPHVGQQGWLLITVDKKIRYNELERRAIVRNRVREFVFTSGNLSGSTMAGLLVKAFPGIGKLCKENDPPFIASITKIGAVHLRFDRHGPIHGRKRTQS
jgi:hypothetical protein